jgi:transcriptional regulator with XRE-family HTH domain
MTASHLSMLERGERAYTQETLESIARALNTDEASLLGRTSENYDSVRQIIEIARTLLPPEESV